MLAGLLPWFLFVPALTSLIKLIELIAPDLIGEFYLHPQSGLVCSVHWELSTGIYTDALLSHSDRQEKTDQHGRVDLAKNYTDCENKNIYMEILLKFFNQLHIFSLKTASLNIFFFKYKVD